MALNEAQKQIGRALADVAEEAAQEGIDRDTFVAWAAEIYDIVTTEHEEDEEEEE